MAIITVTNSNDSGTGSLRAAIAAAKAGDTLQFSSTLAGKTITLTSGQLAVNKNLTIDATAASGLTISGNNASRVIDIAANLNVTLRGLTIANGKTTGVALDGAGGGIRTGINTTLNLQNSVVRNNFANGDGGGGLWASSGSNVTVTNSRFDYNNTNGYQAQGSVGERGGGAIAIGSNSSLNVSGSSFTGNTGINGGAINTVLSTLTVSTSTFKSNDTTKGAAFGPDTRGYGGAIYADGGKSAIVDTISITSSRFDSNKGAGQGGALFLYTYSGGDSITLKNSTVTGNYVAKDAQNLSLGGGLRVGGGGSFTMTNTTVAKNRSLDQGGGLWTGEGSPISINNSTFYGNAAKSFDGKSGLGGAMLLSNNPTTSIVNSTIANNYAAFQGGGFWGGGSKTTLKDTLVTSNKAYNGGNNWNIYHDTGTTFTNGGGNVEYNPYNSNDTKVAPNVTITNPLLGAFVDNGTALQTPPQPGNTLVTAGADPVSGIAAASPDILLASATQVDAIAVGGTNDSSLVADNTTTKLDPVTGVETPAPVLGTPPAATPGNVGTEVTPAPVLGTPPATAPGNVGTEVTPAPVLGTNNTHDASCIDNAFVAASKLQSVFAAIANNLQHGATGSDNAGGRDPFGLHASDNFSGTFGSLRGAVDSLQASFGQQLNLNAVAESEEQFNPAALAKQFLGNVNVPGEGDGSISLGSTSTPTGNSERHPLLGDNTLAVEDWHGNAHKLPESVATATHIA
ncbi:hypothetical protein [Oscillatoria sp. FACHB-1406]|uniref:beta strand repeat-containing protein n=1 Tax=Oscillatoria sp. FACHB-1406 TaxID=2692846 RepID=UPI0016892D98|nr:hypothetical protein [Oscillatoria sp. FACHB-1406]MBD2578266.1 hypothetical protein [Oscillatoria sp. FACHB-1406]